jgi:hypothetical protein
VGKVQTKPKPTKSEKNKKPDDEQRNPLTEKNEEEVITLIAKQSYDRTLSPNLSSVLERGGV